MTHGDADQHCGAGDQPDEVPGAEAEGPSHPEQTRDKGHPGAASNEKRSVLHDAHTDHDSDAYTHPLGRSAEELCGEVGRESQVEMVDRTATDQLHQPHGLERESRTEAGQPQPRPPADRHAPAGNDQRVDATIPTAKENMAKLNMPYEPHVYEGAGHGFLRAQSQNDANAKAAKEAWPATIAFLKKQTE